MTGIVEEDIVMKQPSKTTIVAILLLFIQITELRAEEWRPEVKTLRVNQYDMAYVEKGSGPPLILVHGSLSDYRTWLHLFNELSENNRTIAVSLRHFYPEQWNGKGADLSLQQHADDITAFIQGIKAGPVSLLGHSRGGDVALMVASQHPELVRNLILADPAPLATILANNPASMSFAKARKAKLQEVVNYYQQNDAETGLQIYVKYIAGPTAWQNTSEQRREEIRSNSWTQISQLQDYETPFTCSMAAKITAPVLLITGERSAPVYGHMNSAVRACLKEVSIATIADAGHLMYYANPTAFAFEVVDFITSE